MLSIKIDAFLDSIAFNTTLISEFKKKQIKKHKYDNLATGFDLFRSSSVDGNYFKCEILNLNHKMVRK